MDKIRHAMPNAMRDDFTKLNDQEKASFLLSAFKCDYTPEWDVLYMEVAKWVLDIYKARHRCYQLAIEQSLT